MLVSSSSQSYRPPTIRIGDNPLRDADGSWSAPVQSWFREVLSNVTVTRAKALARERGFSEFPSDTTLKRWRSDAKAGRTDPKHRARKPWVTPDTENKFTSKVAELEENLDAIMKHDITKLAKQAKAEVDAEKKRLPSGSEPPPAAVKQIMKAHLKRRKPDLTTTRREDAKASARNWLSFAGALSVMLADGNYPPELVFNFDATACILKDGEAYYFSKRNDHPRAKGKATTDVLIKTFVACNADGHVLPTHSVLQDAGIDDGKVVIQQSQFAPNSHKHYHESHGTFYGVKKRSDGLFMRPIVQKMMDDMIRLRERLPMERQGYPIVILLDGADENLGVVHRDVDIRTYATERNIQLLKICAGCTHFLQPVDVSSVFRGAKSRIRGEKLTSAEELRETRAHDVQAFAEELRALVPNKKDRNTRENIAAHLLRFGEAMRLTCSDAEIVRKGFRASGVFPFNPKLGLSHCEGLKELDHAKFDGEIMPALRAEFLEKGEISEATFDKFNIPKTTEEAKQGVGNRKELGELVVSRRRAIWLNSDAFRRKTRDREAAEKERVQKRKAEEQEKQMKKKRRQEEKEQKAQVVKRRKEAHKHILELHQDGRLADRGVRKTRDGKQAIDEDLADDIRCMVCVTPKSAWMTKLAEARDFKWKHCKRCNTAYCPVCVPMSVSVWEAFHANACPDPGPQKRRKKKK